ncbi:MAG TPA: RNA-binding cell elongation regulator Jag/EloR [Anaerolineales bacterium]|nr:RNA-binding cell elongation regulator Jag/EloR [Anaerolineales bacterium]
MVSPKTSVEIIAPTVEEAIAQGAAELGVKPGEVLVEVIDEGGQGMLGLGSRQARVRLSLLRRPAPAEPLDDNDLQATEAVVHDLLDHLAVRGTVQAHWGEPSEPDQETPLLVDIEGDDLSVLIGHRGETLSALQYITRLIVARELGRAAPVVIDVAGYRARREHQLRQLARRMADEAVERGKTMTLEPMPPGERRIIHLELRDHEKVYTESVGEGDQRKVTIVLKP